MVIIVDIFDDCVRAIQKKLNMNINYVYGRQSQIIQKLQDMNDSINNKDGKYPLIAAYMDFPERRGNGYYASLVFPKIIICALTVRTNYADVRYSENFRPVLYPIYYEFLHQLSIHPQIVEHDENDIPHTKWDRVGTLPIGADLQDYVDAIEINNLALTISLQLKLCKDGTN
jgi:hypothetical protein